MDIVGEGVKKELSLELFGTKWYMQQDGVTYVSHEAVNSLVITVDVMKQSREWLMGVAKEVREALDQHSSEHATQ